MTLGVQQDSEFCDLEPIFASPAIQYSSCGTNGIIQSFVPRNAMPPYLSCKHVSSQSWIANSQFRFIKTDGNLLLVRKGGEGS